VSARPGYLKKIAVHRFQPDQPGAATTFRFIDTAHMAALKDGAAAFDPTRAPT